MSSIPTCPYCLHGALDEGRCDECDRRVRTRNGVPSVTDRERADPRADQLRELASLDVGESLAPVFEAHRAGRLDATVIDRFFKRRTAGWRVLLEEYCDGRGLVVGTHDEGVALAFAEAMDSVWVADIDAASLEATAAVAAAEGSTVHPVHARVESLPFSAESFDLIVLQCPASDLSRYLPHVTDRLAPDGRLAVMVDGWTRESGLAARLGLAASQRTGLGGRLASAVDAVPVRIASEFERRELAAERAYGLLSRGRHENELAVDVRSDEALTWLLTEFDATTDRPEFGLLRRLAWLGQRTNLLAQCFPRYLYVCGRESIGDRAGGAPADVVAVAGKNRTSVLELADGRLGRIRKVPNSRRHGVANEAAARATRLASEVDEIAATVADAETTETTFGPVRIERPVRGTPLLQSMERDPAAFAQWLDVAFDWLERLQTGTESGVVRKDPADVVADLRDDRLGLPDPPAPEGPVAFPPVLTHGDFFGSNIYVDETAAGREVTGVIDWEWSERRGNPVVDSGFFALRSAEVLWGDFRSGFEALFLERTPYSSVLYDRLAEYAETVDVEPRTIAAYLAIGYVERARKEVPLNGQLDVDWPRKVRCVWNHQDAIERRLVAEVGTETSL